jgi:hypothetical protein
MEPAFLEISDYSLSQKAAEKLVDEKLLLMNLKIPSKNKSKEIITFKKSPKEKEEKHKYIDLIKNTRKQGVVYPVQTIIDRSDQIFGGKFGMSTPTQGLTITTTYAGYSKVVKGPGRCYPIEYDLAGDIIFYREESCFESDDHDFEMTCRNYRGYLFSCISLIDAYINRHILIGKNKKLSSEKFDILINCLNLEEKIELFLEIFCGSSIKAINQSVDWSDFKLLKGLRNELVHATSPFLGVTIEEIAKNLNLCMKGIGGILKRFQELQGRHSLGFIERIRNAPKVFHNEIVLRADGKHRIKKIIK